jgi:hypothetical protein
MTLFESKQNLQQLYKIARSLDTELLETVPYYAEHNHTWTEPCIHELNYRQVYMMLQTLSEILNDSNYELIMLTPSQSRVAELSSIMTGQIRILEKVRDKIIFPVIS